MVSINSDDLKHRFRSTSRYKPIWDEIKRNGICSVEVKDNAYDTISAAITKLKKQDFCFRAACDIEQGHEFTLVFEEDIEASRMTIKFKDTVNKSHPYNLL